MPMKDAYGTHSFQHHLQTLGQDYRDYELSDFRHAGLIRFLERQLPENRRGLVVDVGCGSGVISRGLSSAFANVIGIDQNPGNVALSAQLTDDAGVRNVRYEQGLATRLPVADGVADFAVLNGVLEWAGVNDRGERPQAVQVRVLREILRILKPGGALYIGIENRWHPRTLLVDPHTHLPLVNALPRPVASVVSRAVRHVPFHAHIYGWRTLRRMLVSAGYATITVYVPFPGYRLPCHYIPLGNREAMLRAIDDIDIAAVEVVKQQTHVQVDVARAVARLRRRARLGVLGLITHDFSLIATKH